MKLDTFLVWLTQFYRCKILLSEKHLARLAWWQGCHYSEKYNSSARLRFPYSYRRHGSSKWEGSLAGNSVRSNHDVGLRIKGANGRAVVLADWYGWAQDYQDHPIHYSSKWLDHCSCPKMKGRLGSVIVGSDYVEVQGICYGRYNSWNKRKLCCVSLYLNLWLIKKWYSKSFNQHNNVTVQDDSVSLSTYTGPPKAF